MSFPAPIPLSLALVGFTPAGVSGLRSQIERAASLGFRAVTLNAAAPDARPRDLGRSARRDLAALIRRHSMTSGGVDLWLPPEHLVQPAQAERALEALLDAVDFAADLAELTSGRAVVSTLLLSPDHAGVEAALGHLRLRAASRSTRIADHRWPRRPPAGTDGAAPPAPEESPDSPIGIGLDPAHMFLTEGPLSDPGAAASRHAPRVFSARLSDANGSGRCPIGTPSGGRLDVLAYTVALATAGYKGSLAADVRGLRDPEAGARAALAAVAPVL